VVEALLSYPGDVPPTNAAWADGAGPAWSP
jgi:hypothetical protein